MGVVKDRDDSHLPPSRIRLSVDQTASRIDPIIAPQTSPAVTTAAETSRSELTDMISAKLLYPSTTWRIAALHQCNAQTVARQYGGSGTDLQSGQGDFAPQSARDQQKRSFVRAKTISMPIKARPNVVSQRIACSVGGLRVTAS